MPDYVSPNPENYVVGKANLYFTPVGGTRRHMGNCTSAEFEPTIEKLEHFSSMAGVKSKDKVVTLERGGTVSITLEEWNRHNMALAVLGDIGVDSNGNVVIPLMTKDATEGRLEIIASNDVGPRWTWDFNKVSLAPTGGLGQITDDWAPIEFEGDVLTTDTGFGTLTLQDSNETESE